MGLEKNRALLTVEAAVRKAGGNAKDLPPGSGWWVYGGFLLDECAT